MKKLPHETRAHDMAIKLARKAATARWPHQYANLRRQAVRAANSVVLNLSEAAWKTGNSAAASYRIALGELGETASAFQLGGIRCWRRQVEALYDELVPLAGCDFPGLEIPPVCSVTESLQDEPTGRPRSKKPSRFPKGAPWDHTFDTPDGLPRTMRDMDMLREWLDDYQERFNRGELDEWECDDWAPDDPSMEDET